MIQKLKKEIEKELLSIEPGRFQEFCLRFFPLENQKYNGLIRHGSTYDGKTRKGTPDLIKTNSDGSQIAIECGTEAGYWTVTIENIEDSKPIKDGLKCLNKLLHLNEIVFASSQEIPTNMQNSHSLIIQYFKKKNDALTVRCFSSQNFAEKITSSDIKNDPNLYLLLKDFFPDVWANFENAQKIEAYNEALKIGSNLLGSNFTRIIDHCLNASTQASTSEKINFLKEELFGLGRFEIRNTPLNFIERDLTFIDGIDFKNKTYQLIGVPKIGKSYLLHSLKSNYSIKIINVPLAADEQKLLLQALEVQEKINEILAIDNIDRFSEENIKVLNEIISLRSESFNAGIILVSNLHYKHRMTCIDELIVAPKWSSKELKQIIHNDALSPKELDEYFLALASISGGHPLIAKSIASKANKTEDIYLNKIFLPKVTDEKLSRETSSFLFEKALQSTDEINFVTRLSNCTYSVDEEEIEAICKLEPSIKTPAKLIISKIGPTIFEGNISKGFEINSVFKDVAKEVSSKSDSRNVYSALADCNWRIKDNTIEGYPAIKSIHYLVMSERVNEAYARAMFLISGLYKERDTQIIEDVIGQVEVLFFLKEDILRRDAWTYINSTLFKISAFSLLEKTKRHRRHVAKIGDIDINKLSEFCNEVNITISNDIIASVVFSMIHHFESIDNKKNALIQITNAISAMKELPEFAKDIFPYFCWVIPIHDIDITRLFSNLIETISHYDYKIASAMAANWGAFLKNKLEITNIIEITNNFNKKSLTEILKSNYVDLVSVDENMLISSLANDGIEEDDYEESILIILADKIFTKKQFASAERYYLLVSAASTPTSINFLHGWASWRLSLIRNHNNDLINSLAFIKKAYEQFIKSRSYGYAYRMLGAMTIQHIRTKNFKEAITCAENLFDEFFIKSKKKAGPAVKVLSAQLLRQKKEFKDINYQQDGLVFPALEINLYDTFPDTIEISDNGTLPYSFLFHLANEEGDQKLMAKLLIKSLSQPFISGNDEKLFDITAKEIFQLEELDQDLFNDDFIEVMSKKIVHSIKVHQAGPFEQDIAFEVFLGEAIRLPQERRKIFSSFFYRLCNKAIKYLDSNPSYDSDLSRAFLNYYIFCHGADLGHNRSELQIVLNRAMTHALKGNIRFILIESYYNKLINYSDSIPNFATANFMFFEILKNTIAMSNFGDRLDTFGERLYNFWNQENFRTKDEEDAQILKYMKHYISKIILDLMCKSHDLI